MRDAVRDCAAPERHEERAHDWRYSLPRHRCVTMTRCRSGSLAGALRPGRPIPGDDRLAGRALPGRVRPRLCDLVESPALAPTPTRRVDAAAAFSPGVRTASRGHRHDVESPALAPRPMAGAESTQRLPSSAPAPVPRLDDSGTVSHIACPRFRP